MERVIDIVLKKKELQNINRRVAKSVILENLNTKIEELIRDQRFKTKRFKSFVKKIRAQLRRQYGAFQNPKIDRKALIKKKDYVSLLKSYLSSKERLKHYPILYKQLFEITGKPNSILDIGCGMNPISYEYMNIGRVKYLACDISDYDLNVIKEYFSHKNGIKGEVKVFDAAREKYDFKKEYNVCFAFKLFEILETTKSHRLTEEIFKKLPAEWVIASFSTKTLSGARMKRRRRVWFEVMLKRLGREFRVVEIPNEIFYVIKKK